jgi:hypothetical protein
MDNIWCVAPTLAHQISPPAGYLGRHPTIAKPRSLVLMAHAEIVVGRLNCIYLQTSLAPLWSSKQWFKTKHM